MAGSFLRLASKLEKRAANVSEEASRLAVACAEAIVKDLAHVTPIDTSQAVSNWQIGIEKPINPPQLAPHFSGSQGSTGWESAQETIAEAQQKLDGKKPGQKIYLSNVTPYIRDLNDGSSRQTPAGFVERAVLIGRSTIRKFLRK